MSDYVISLKHGQAESKIHLTGVEWDGTDEELANTIREALIIKIVKK